MKTPWLKKIDLRKTIKRDDYVDHPDIKTNCTYLIRLNNEWFCGNFYRDENGSFFTFIDDYIPYTIDLDDSDIKGVWQIRIGKYS